MQPERAKPNLALATSLLLLAMVVGLPKNG